MALLLSNARPLTASFLWLTVASTSMGGCVSPPKAVVGFEQREPVALTGVAGEEFVIQLQDGPTILGMWSSPSGIHLTLTGESGTPFGAQQLLSAKPKNWGSAISYARVEDLVFNSTHFTVPTVPGKRLTGRISGTLVVPRPRGGGFSDESIDVNIPILLEVIPPKAR